jgi:tetratricopeptide (TPR) repeat protein
MARGTQHRKRRPTADARVAQPAPVKKQPKVKHERWEDELFFSRLRAHAKWVFVFLALVFGLGFVLFGVGSGSSGITDAMQNLFQRSSSGGSSLSALQNKVKKEPKNAQAWRELASKLEQDQRIDRAIVSLQRYTRLKPKDLGAIEELAGLYTRRASDYFTLYSGIRAEQDVVSTKSIFRPSVSSPFGKAFQQANPTLTVVDAGLDQRLNNALQRLGVLNGQALDAYKRLVKQAPENATYQLQLAQVAQNLQDKKTAITAYKAFLKLAPNDPLATRARQALKDLSAPATAAAAGK